MDQILHPSSEWFGVEEAIEGYVSSASRQVSFVAVVNDMTVGVAFLQRHFRESAPIADGCQLLQVHTTQASNPLPYWRSTHWATERQKRTSEPCSSCIAFALLLSGDWLTSLYGGTLGGLADSEAVTTQGSTVEDWTRALAESTGSPGGGAGAGVMLAVAASLTSMVAGYTEVEEHQSHELADIRTRARSLREIALRLADDDAAASQAFGSAFRREPGTERTNAIHRASMEAAKSSAELGERAIDAIGDLGWLASNGNPALIADAVVAFGALRAAVTGARTNVSFDLAALKSGGVALEQIQKQHPALWATVERLNSALDRIDGLTGSIDHRAAPTDAVFMPRGTDPK